MKFTLTFNMDNAAFEDGGYEELRSILHEVSQMLDIEEDPNYGPVRDSNGNTIGEWRIEG